MNKVSRMQVNKVNLLHRAGRVMLCAMALLALGSCRDDLQEPKGKTSEQTTQIPINDYIGKVDVVIEATLEPMPDQGGRGLDFSLIDRSKKIGLDGNTVPADVDYSGEVAPRMYLTEGSTERGFLIFYHDSGKVVRKAVAFEVIEGVKKKDGTINPKAKNIVRFLGKVDFPEGVTLADEFSKSSDIVSNDEVAKDWFERIDPGNTTKSSGWHVMAMIGHQDVTDYYTNADATGTEPYNRMLIGSNNGTRYQLASSESYDDAFAEGNSVRINTPCASAWMPLYIAKAPPALNPTTGQLEESSATGVNLGLHFKPQGVILQYYLASMANDTQDLRRVGLVSNVLDFKGYYDLNSASIANAFKNRDNNGYGLPKWVPNEPNMEDLSMNYAPKSESPLSSGDRVFPWDMPTLSSNRATTLSNWPNSGTNEWPVEKGSVLSVYPLGSSDNNTTGRPTTYPWLQASKLWTFYALGGSRRARSTNSSRKILYFWGMPRTTERMPVESKRGTYLFASSYSLMTDDDAWDAPGGFDTDQLQDLVNLANDYANKLINMEKELNAARPEDKPQLQANYDAYKKAYETDENFNLYRSDFPGPIFEAAKTAMQKSGEYVRDANNTKITPRTQPLMVLHQTNRTFDERKVYHAQVVIRPDLMLSEVIYQKHGGQNYSLLEVYNTIVEPVDLSQYAVVRLIRSNQGEYLTFRGPNGQPVESLDQALVLPLTALKGDTDPFASSALNSLKPKAYTYDDAANRACPIYYESSNYTVATEGFWSGKWDYGKVVDESTTHLGRSFYLMQGQSILLGGSGYVNSPVTKKETYYTVNLLDPNSWFKPINELLKVNKDNAYLRYAYAYADGVKKSDNTFGAGTLDYEPGDAFALIKKTSTGWQIIDATGPVGPAHLAFAGTYDSFKTEMAKHSNDDRFSLQRLDGVNYPFIAPFRTKRLYPSKWSDDWTIQTDVNQFTPGRRFGYNGWELSFGNWDYQFKRSPIDTQFTTYQNARPTKGR